LKIYEEKELELRFGESYLDYKRNTPFLLPSINRSDI
jgi:protein-S-isoprenylcysteine O-methyltransferase Ste14